MQSAVDNGGYNSNKNNADLSSVNAKLNANYVLLKSNDDNLTLVKTNLESSVDSLKTVDKTEASLKALLATNNLSASYSLLQNAMSVSLLNYLS